MITSGIFFGIAAYLAGALLIHFVRGDIHRKVVLEYAGFAMLAVAIAISLFRNL